MVHGFFRRHCRRRQLAVARARRAAIDEILVERAKILEKCAQLLLVFAGDGAAQACLVDRLGSQLGDEAARIGVHPPILLRLASECLGLMQERVAILVAQHLQPDAEVSRVAEDALVMLWQPGRARVQEEIRIVVPIHLLAAVDLFDHRATAHGEHASAWPIARLQYGDLKACLAELECRDETCNAGSEYHDSYARA